MERYPLITIDGVTYYEEYEEAPDDEEETYEIFDGKICPICGKPMMSNEYITSITLPADVNKICDRLIHSSCLKDDALETLEKLGYAVVEDLGKYYE